MNQPWRTSQSISDYLQVRFFSPTEGIDPNIVEILNSKLLEMKQEYDRRLTILSDDLNEKAKKIQAYQELAPSSYGLLDMNLQQILEGVKAIEKDSSKLWKNLTKVYSRQFFDSIIEEEYKDYLNDISQKEMIRCINKIKKESADQLNEVRLSMEAEKKSLRYQINMKIEENQYLRQSNINMINRARRDEALASEEKFKEHERQIMKKFEEEKQALIDELMSLKKFSEDHNYFKNQMTLRLALVKFRYTIQIMKVRDGQKVKPIKDITDDLRRVVMGRQIQEHEERLKELEDLKLQHEHMRLRDSNNIYKMHELNERIVLLDKNIQEMQDENGAISSQLARERQEVRTLKLENHSLLNSDKINKEIISILENDKAEMKEKVESLSKQLELKDPEFLGAGSLRDMSSKLFMKKTLQQMNADKFESMRQIINEDVREISTMTDIRGVENELILNAFDPTGLDIPSLPKLNIAIQTDKELYQNMHPDIPLSDVTAYHKMRAMEAEMKRLKQIHGIDKNSYNDRMVSGTDEDNSDNNSPDASVKKKFKKKLKTKRKEVKKSDSKLTKKLTDQTPIAKEPSPPPKVEIEEKSETLEKESLNNEMNNTEEIIDTHMKPATTVKTRRVISLSQPKTADKKDSDSDLKVLEEEIDKKTVEHIFRLKEANPQINPEIFAKAIEYIRIGANKKKKLCNLETPEQQFARLYPENQPKVFRRLWEEVETRKKKQDRLKRLQNKRMNEQWVVKMREFKKAIWGRLMVKNNDLSNEIYNTQTKFDQNKTTTSSVPNVIKFPRARELSKNNNSSSGRIDTAQSEKSCLIINSANLNIINPQKLRENLFASHMDQSIGDNTPFGKYSIGTQTDIKGRIYDEIDDEILDEIIDMNIQNLNLNTSNFFYFGNSDISEYDVIDSCPPGNSSKLSMWRNRRGSDQPMLDKSSSALSNKMANSTIGPLSQRVSIYRKKHSKIRANASTNSSVVFTRKKFGGIVEGKQTISQRRPSIDKGVSAFEISVPKNDKSNEDSYLDYSSINPVVKIQRPPQSKISPESRFTKQNKSRDNIKVEETGIIGEGRKQKSIFSINI